MTAKLPKKFVMTTKYARAEKYTMEQYEEGMYHITEVDGRRVEGNTAKHTEAFVKACLDEGSWILEKDLDEREMVFPFTFVCPEGENPIVYTATKGQSGGVDVDWEDNSFGAIHYSEASVKDYIKEGSWIVKHVGEKVEEKTSSFIGNTSNGTGLYFESGAITAKGLHITAPPATGVGSLKIDVECNTADAIVNIDRLAQAVENLNVAMESYLELQAEMKGQA